MFPLPLSESVALLLIDQLTEVYIDSQLETVDTTNWYPKVMRKAYTVGLNLTGSFVDDPTIISTGTTRVVRK